MSLSAESQSAPQTDVRIRGLGTRAPIWRDLLASVRENSPLLILVLLLWIGAETLSAVLGRPGPGLDQWLGGYEIHIAICVASFAVAFILWILHTAVRRRISIQTGQFWRLVVTEFASRERILLAFPVLALWPVMALSFSLVKALIPAAVPFYLDPFLHAADRAMLLGHDPWAVLQPLLGHPIVTYVIDRLYALWLFVMYFALLLQITSTRDRVLRLRFLFSNMLAWILLGGMAAILLSSAGPCYFGQVVGAPDPYAPLMSYLHDTVEHNSISIFGVSFTPELIALRVQDLLWGSYQQGNTGVGSGISAAPSLHVASTWLIARMLQTYGRRGAIFGWGFFSVILLGSVHLGWHYLCDGLISIAAAWMLWRVVGWWLNRPAVRRLLWPNGVPHA